MRKSAKSKRNLQPIEILIFWDIEISNFKQSEIEYRRPLVGNRFHEFYTQWIFKPQSILKGFLTINLSVILIFKANQFNPVQTPQIYWTASRAYFVPSIKEMTPSHREIFSQGEPLLYFTFWTLVAGGPGSGS